MRCLLKVWPHLGIISLIGSSYGCFWRHERCDLQSTLCQCWCSLLLKRGLYFPFCCSAVLLGACQLGLESLLGGKEAVTSQHRDEPHDLWPLPHTHKAQYRWPQGKDVPTPINPFLSLDTRGSADSLYWLFNLGKHCVLIAPLLSAVVLNVLKVVMVVWQKPPTLVERTSTHPFKKRLKGCKIPFDLWFLDWHNTAHKYVN